MTLSIAAVLPRYGADLGGGAEALVRSLLLKLAAREGERARIEVWTTCARDHRTWANELPAGRTIEDGIAVHRFPVDPRSVDIFLTAELGMQAGKKLTVPEQLDWLAHSVNSRGLYSHLSREGRAFDAILFAPYLFATTFWGALIHPDRSILIPCLHNEHYAYLEVIRHLFRSVRGLIFNAEPERQLAAELYGIESIAGRDAVVGMGFDPVEPLLTQQRRRAPYLLYSGRKEEGKNLHKLIAWFSAGRARFPELELVLIGAGEIGFLKELPAGVTDLGFVSALERDELMADAVALCQPSTNESFSIVLMEAWQRETPVLVHAQCDVTRFHAVQSGGGLYFANGDEFVAVVEQLLRNPQLRNSLGQGGRRYVESVYSWSAVLERLDAAFAKFGIGEQMATALSTEIELEQ